MSAESFVRGKYFEEFEIGLIVKTVSRTITEGDIYTFAAMTGDNNQIHTDAEYSKLTPFGERIAHGLLIMSIASGLAVRTGLLEGTVIAFREVKNWKFSKPVFIGDTIRAEIETIAMKPLRRLGGGSVQTKIRVYNQKDALCMVGEWNFLVANKPKEA